METQFVQEIVRSSIAAPRGLSSMIGFVCLGQRLRYEVFIVRSTDCIEFNKVFQGVQKCCLV